MSAIAQGLACHEVALSICRYLPLRVLSRLGQTCRGLTAVVRAAVKLRIDEHLRRYFDNPNEIRTLMSSTQSLLMGEIPLSIVLQNDDWRPLYNPILSIVVPCGLADVWRREMFRKGYSRWPVIVHRTSDADIGMLDDNGQCSATRKVRIENTDDSFFYTSY